MASFYQRVVIAAAGEDDLAVAVAAHAVAVAAHLQLQRFGVVRRERWFGR